MPSYFCHFAIVLGDGWGGNRNEDDDDNDELPYCNQIDTDQNGIVSCFDSKDYEQDTGLYPCRDGSKVGDYRDCPDRGSDDGDDNNNGVDDEDDEEEETANCGGESCTPTEKEDSWLDE